MKKIIYFRLWDDNENSNEVYPRNLQQDDVTAWKHITIVYDDGSEIEIK